MRQAKCPCQKIYRFFVNDAVDEQKVNWLADRFYKNDYDIAKLMADIFTSDWFYDEKNIGAKIKSPVELIVGIRRVLPMQLENEEALMVIQRVLGQVLFYPPNVAGWPGGKSWIDSSSLMMRMRIPKLIDDVDEMNVRPKDDDDSMMGMKDADAMKENPNSGKQAKNMYAGMRRQQIKANVDWTHLIKSYEKVSRENLMTAIAGNLLQVRSGVGNDLVKKYTDETSRDAFIKSATLQFMCMPEYQLC